ncbi:MarR family transcriptional regulator [Pedobacter yulinensis]|uniref:MarR family transcriptional regulator n=1 Tax=Pedobacter yulinensis TaxID=2126353 RepID=A0A2T3HHL5_9SPHI|nr:MarR family transcriptional regulator [Pedobacter yulinensis]PST81946.1 MarR family transcriptional regulator [Pedobacter yulinensis]
MKSIKEPVSGALRLECDQALINLLSAASRCNLEIREMLRGFQVTSQQFNVLRILQGQYPAAATISLLKQKMIDKMSDISRIIDRLLQKKFVVRQPGHADRRTVDIKINETGLALLEKIDRAVSLSSFISERLSLDEAKTLNRLLAKLHTTA